VRNAERTRERLAAAFSGTGLETAAGDGWQTERVAEHATVTEIGSANGIELPAAAGGELTR
jgi:hypothetical protein